MTEYMQQTYIKFNEGLQSLRDNEEGQGMVEYALILALIAIVSIAVLTTLGTDIKGAFQSLVDKI